MNMVPLFIPVVNRLDLLQNAIGSAICPLVDIIVIDNTPEGISVSGVECKHPPVPLTFTQSQNWMLRMAKSKYAPFYLWMHSDAETSPQDLFNLVKMASEETRRWGVIYTYYDTLAAYKTDALDSIGGYDTNFSDYYSDNDMHRRLKLAGYELLESHIQTKHLGSQTINSDPKLRFLHQIKFPMAREYYKAKWGGEPDRERFVRPFNGMIDGV